LVREHLRLTDKSTLHQRVVSRLREAILKGEFQPGERLIQEELAEAMGVSRMPVREAIRQLEREGLVTVEAHKGAVVTPLTPEDIEEIYELRAMLEALAIQRSLPHLSMQDQRELRQLAAEMEAAAVTGDVERFVEFNAVFHRQLRKGCSWRRVHQFLEMMWHGYPPHTPHILQGQMERSVKEHAAMVQAVEEGDCHRLQTLIRQHILRTGAALKAYLQKTEPKGRVE
jgi:DNA-binding GntR family transcriptional regulator